MFPEQFQIEFKKSNSRLTQPILIEHIEFAARYLASKEINCCISIQPGHSGYHWSERKVIMVFLWNDGEKIRIRYIKRNSYRNSEITPGCFKEMRGFPRGNMSDKLIKWSNQIDCLCIDICNINKCESLPIEFYDENCETTSLVFYREYRFDHLI